MRVGQSDESQAAYYLQAQSEIDAFLKLALDARGGATALDARATG